ncbi:hypothetical protein WG922_06085 [Ramlibacter sp. AN1015]|uniref:hypothetical protein n=1 Tax=Ramlibacter sp. AN1015 TaxID=3133428 RepID=UPI0030C2E91E
MTDQFKLKGLMAAAAAAFAVGGALAQSVPPDADVANEAIGAGQQNAYGAPMGETGINEVVEAAPAAVFVPIAVVTPAQPVVQAPAEVIIVTPPEAERVAQAQPEPRQPEPQVAQAPVFTPQEPARTFEAPRMRADRN